MEPSTAKMADRTDPPLVSSDDDAGTPLLSSGPMLQEENGSSQMMARLMQRPEIEPTEFIMVEEEEQQEASEFSLTVVVSATLTLLQCCLVWASYLSDSWSDTHLLTSVDWQRKYFPFLNNYTDSIIQTIDLGSILSILRASQDYVLLAVVVVTSVGIPCLSIMTNSMAVTRQYYKTFTGPSHFDLALRFSFVIIFLMVLLDLASSFTIEWTDTAFRVQNCMRGSLFCYLVGMTAAVGVVAVLRFSHATSKASIQQLQHARIPPAAAFRHPWPVESYNDSDDALEEPERRQSSWYPCFTWQLGLATGVMLLPSFSLPLLSVSYQGLAAEFMSNTEREIYLWQLPQLLWTPCNDNKWMLVVSQVILVFQTVIHPLAALLCGTAMLRATSTHAKDSFRKRLSCLHPMVNGVTLALTILLFTPALETMTSYLLNQEDSSGLCAKLNNTVGEPCLAITGTILPGSWFFLVQSILLEVFIILTLSK